MLVLTRDDVATPTCLTTPDALGAGAIVAALTEEHDTLGAGAIVAALTEDR